MVVVFASPEIIRRLVNIGKKPPAIKKHQKLL